MSTTHILMALNNASFVSAVQTIARFGYRKRELDVVKELAVAILNQGIPCLLEQSQFKLTPAALVNQIDPKKKVDLYIPPSHGEVLLEAKYHFEGDLARISAPCHTPLKDGADMEFWSEIQKTYSTHFLWIVFVRDPSHVNPDGGALPQTVSGVERYQGNYGFNKFYGTKKAPLTNGIPRAMAECDGILKAVPSPWSHVKPLPSVTSVSTLSHPPTDWFSVGTHGTYLFYLLERK